MRKEKFYDNSTSIQIPTGLFQDRHTLFLRTSSPPAAHEKAADRGPPLRFLVQESIPREVRYFLTISATLKVMASSNSRRSRPVSFLIFSSR